MTNAPMTFDPKEARTLVEHFKNDQPVTQDMQSTMMAEEMQLAADALTAALDENQRLLSNEVRAAAKVLAEAMERREWAFYPIELPVNENGEGPATVGTDATSIVYEVWEADTLRTLSSHKTLPDAITAALRAIAEGDRP